MTILFDTNSPWYYGTDGRPPSDQFDFVTWALFAIGRSLGFAGSGRVVSGQGSWGTEGRPYPYDHYVADGSGRSFLSFANPSSALGVFLTSDNGFWRGANGVIANRGVTPRLAVSGTGSGYVYLHESTFSRGNPNSLFTPFLEKGEAIHDPGPIVLGMMADIGWTAGPPAATPTAMPLPTRTSTPTPTPGVCHSAKTATVRLLFPLAARDGEISSETNDRCRTPTPGGPYPGPGDRRLRP
jgi:hypothetical protein